MTRSTLFSCAVAAGVASALALWAPAVSAQRGGGAAPAAPANVPTPRAADGHPDLTGRWGGGGGGAVGTGGSRASTKTASA